MELGKGNSESGGGGALNRKREESPDPGGLFRKGLFPFPNEMIVADERNQVIAAPFIPERCEHAADVPEVLLRSSLAEELEFSNDHVFRRSKDETIFS